MVVVQKNRQVRLNTALGENALTLRNLQMSEGLGRMFEMTMTADVEEPDIDLDDLIGRNLTVSLETREDGAPRHWNAYVTRARLMASRERQLAVRISAAPWLWFLTLTKTCRIFENKTAPDIISEVLESHQFSDFEIKKKRDYPKKVYCVQYNETDFNFIQRLMEHEGIYYYFEHQNGSHKMMIVDAITHHQPYAGYETFPYVNTARGGEDAEEGVRAWMQERVVRPTIFAHTAYDFESPGADLDKDAEIVRKHAGANFGFYEWPVHYKTGDDGGFYAKTRIEALQATHARAYAEASLRGVESGRSFTLANAPIDGADGDHVVVSADHSLSAPSTRAGEGGGETYECSFVAMPSREVFRPSRLTPKPRIPGPQTAIVTGADGEEIDPDSFGRVKVTFHWLVGTPSCWVRVAQAWAGAGFGAMAIPRIGDEVIVAFEDGDPDRPLIVGSLYNAASKFPYDPPDNRTVTAIKTNTSKGGGGFNELRFDDKKGAENVFIHAQKDLDLRVRDTTRGFVGGETHHTTKKKAFLKIEEDRHETMGADDYLTVTGDRNVDIDGSLLARTGGDWQLTAEGDMGATVTGDIGAKAGGKLLVEGAGGLIAQTGADLHLKAGGAVVIEAGQQLTLKVGGNFVVIGPAGVDIKGSMVKINSGGAAGSGAGTKPAAATKPAKAEPPKEAKTAEPGEAAQPPSARERPPTAVELDSHPTSAALRAARESGAPFCEECAKAAAEAAA